LLKVDGAYLATRGDSETMWKQHPWIKDAIAKTRSWRGVVIGFIGADRGRENLTTSRPHISEPCRTMFISGVPCIRGEVPRTEIHALELDITGDSNLEIRLTPIV